MLQVPGHERPREITIDPSESAVERRMVERFLSVDQGQSSEVLIICYRIHLLRENNDVFAYLLKNINPNGVWYEKKVRDGDRLIRLDGQDTTHIPYENVYSMMHETDVPFTCQVVWHPELYLEFGKQMLILTIFMSLSD